MSYILDALRKADAERRGVPAPQGLTEPAVLVTADPDADLPPSPTRPWAWVLGGVAVALAASVGWHLWRHAPSDGAPAFAGHAPSQQGQEPMPPPDGQGPAAMPGQSQLPPPRVPGEGLPPPPPQGQPNGAANPGLPPPAAMNPDTLPNFPPPLPEPPKAETPRAVAPATTGAPAAAPPPGITLVPPPGAKAQAAAAGDRVYTVADLPESVRRDLPRLAVGGAMYSERVADRMVILNGQVFHEGDALGKDLKLRQIKLKTAVLEFRGYRVEIAY